MSALPCPHCGVDIFGYGMAPEACSACGQSLLVRGRYRIRGLLGRGGLGVVYDAVREEDGLPVAVKVVGFDSHVDWASRELFEASTHTLQGLRHNAVPQVYDFFQDDAGRMFLVRESFAGGTLADRISQWHRHLEPAEIRLLLERTLEILSYLHGLVPPVLHRDIKPANIMFRSRTDWDPVLVDFDTVTADGGRRTGLTLVGTPGYAAPEQFAGDAAPSSDLYALGVTMLFVVTHLEPGELSRHKGRFDLGDRLDALDKRTRRVLLKLVETNPEDRYQSAREALADLREPPRRPPVPPDPRPVQRSGLAAVTMAVGVLVAIGVAGAVIYTTQMSTSTVPRVQRAVEDATRSAQKAVEEAMRRVAEARRDAMRKAGERVRRHFRRSRPKRTKTPSSRSVLPTPPPVARASKKRTASAPSPNPPKPTTPRPESSFRREACAGVLGCYRRHGVTGVVRGKVVVEVGTDGRATAARYESGSAPTAVQSCIAAAARRHRVRGYWGGPGRLTCDYVGSYKPEAPLISYRRTFQRK